MQQVERIGCLNNGVFTMGFAVQWIDAGGVWHTSSWSSGHYESGLYRVSPPLASVGVPADAVGVAPYVTAVLGRSVRAAPLVQPAANGRLAAYVAEGTTLSYDVKPLPWKNWAQNVVHTMTIDGQYYFTPTTRAELQSVLNQAAAAGATVRVSGQRHSQPPLVTADNRTAPDPSRWLIDLCCYADLGPNGDQSIVLDPGGATVTVNTGVREDELDAFLTANNRMLQTVTAGGFFSVGGMTAVDVHGATVAAPIFAETATAFTIMGADGQVRTIDANTPAVGGWSPLRFARVSLGALGVVTSVTIAVQPRPWATTLRPGKDSGITCSTQAEFVARFQPLLNSHDRVETFLNPYTNRYLALWWDTDANPPTKTPNLTTRPAGACALAGEAVFGAPYLIPMELVVEPPLIAAQYSHISTLARLTIDAGFTTVEGFFDDAVKVYSDLWLTKASRVMFMSYFVELPALDAAGLGKAWQGLNAVAARLQQTSEFLPVAPMEFRFIRGGDTALAGTYTTTPGATFVNLDLIGYVDAVPGAQYPAALLRFFADVERAWVGLGGEPHTGKMFGFYDPGQPAGSYSPPFNAGFVKGLAARRGARVAAFEAYRKACDPAGRFRNDFVAAMLGG